MSKKTMEEIHQQQRQEAINKILLQHDPDAINGIRIDPDAIKSEMQEWLDEKMPEEGEETMPWLAEDITPEKMLSDKIVEEVPIYQTQNCISPYGNCFVSDPEKDEMKASVAAHFYEILKALKFDVNDENLKETPERIARMYVDEIFSGCYTPMPKITTFTCDSDEMVYVGKVDFNSNCSHHFVFFTGHAYIAYIPGKKLVGLSKPARLVDWFAKRPQLQEKLVEQIADTFMEIMEPAGVGVHLVATHNCMACRGAMKPNSRMRNTALRGCFKNPEVRSEFFDYIKLDK